MLDVLGTLGLSFIVALVGVLRAYSSSRPGASDFEFNVCPQNLQEPQGRAEPSSRALPPVPARPLRCALFTCRLWRRQCLCGKLVGGQEMGAALLAPQPVSLHFSGVLSGPEGHPVKKQQWITWQLPISEPFRAPGPCTVPKNLGKARNCILRRTWHLPDGWEMPPSAWRRHGFATLFLAVVKG